MDGGYDILRGKTKGVPLRTWWMDRGRSQPLECFTEQDRRMPSWTPSSSSQRDNSTFTTRNPKVSPVFPSPPPQEMIVLVPYYTMATLLMRSRHSSDSPTVLSTFSVPLILISRRALWLAIDIDASLGIYHRVCHVYYSVNIHTSLYSPGRRENTS